MTKFSLKGAMRTLVAKLSKNLVCLKIDKLVQCLFAR